jgi:hypothetical protein
MIKTLFILSAIYFALVLTTVRVWVGLLSVFPIGFVLWLVWGRD